MRFEKRRLLSWLLPSEEWFNRKYLWDNNSRLPGNISWSLYCKTLEEFVGKDFLEKDGENYRMTPKGRLKKEEIEKRRNS